MAKVSPVIPFSNTPGNFSVYKMKDVEKLVIRAKHGPTRKNWQYSGNMKSFGFIYRSLGVLARRLPLFHMLSLPNILGWRGRICQHTGHVKLVYIADKVVQTLG